jgi:hypothetical protein
VGCGLIYAVANYTTAAGLPFGSAWYFVLIAVLSSGVVLKRGELTWLRERLTSAEKVGLLASVFVGLIFLIMWWHAAGHLGQLLPNHDAMYHSYAIRNIIETQSTKVDDALRLFPLGAGTAADFYPLGLHSVIALSSRISGTSINGAMNMVTLALAIGVFPLSMWMWTRELLGNSMKIAVMTPVAVFMLSAVFPWSPMSWGGMPAIVAMCIAPAVSVYFVDVLYETTQKGILLITIAMIGMFSLHSPELILVFCLTSVLLIRRRKIPYRNILYCGLRIGLGSAIALGPVVVATVGGARERSLGYQPKIDVVTTVGQSIMFSLTGFALPIATLLVVIGVIQSNREKNSILSWSLSTLILITVLAAGFPENPVVRLLTKPWYGQVLRINYNIVYFAVPLIVCSFAWMFSKKSNLFFRVFSVGVAVLSLFVGVAQAHRADKLLLEGWYRGLVPANQNSVSAYHWIAKNAGADEYVLTDYDGIDGSTWMYALSGARPTMYGAITDVRRDKWRSQKIQVLENIGKLSERADLIKFLDQVNIRYIYFDERTNVISPHHTFTLNELRGDSALTEVYSQGNAHVFRINS